MKLLVRRAAVLLAAPALAASTLAATAPAAQAAVTTPPAPAATAAASWLDGKLVDGLVDPAPAYAGQTIDFGLSLVATGASPASIAKVRAGVDRVLTGYTDGKAGATAKAAHFYEAIGADASRAGASSNVNLVTTLEGFVDDGTGQLGSFPSAYDQVYAVQALREVGSAEAGPATEFLVDDLHCAGAGWGYEDNGCVSDVDTTAGAILALQPYAGTASVDAVLAEGIAWLESQQATDGGFGFGGVANANSTGVAGWALGVAGRSVSSAKAAGWVAAHQVVALPACGATKADADNGAIAYDRTDLETARQGGISAEDLGRWKFATAQALAALAYLPTSTPTLTAPKGYVDAGKTVTLTVAGLRAGETACLSGISAGTMVTGPGGAVSVTLPATTADHVVTLATVGKPVTATVRALGAAKLKVKGAKKAARGDKQKLTVSGLASDEKVTVTVKGTKVDKGTANAKGVFKAVFKVTGKPGKRTVKVAGQFADRKGKATFKVVR